MTTEYRQGIPSHAHIEAATRLGLLWRAFNTDYFWRFDHAGCSTYGSRLSAVQNAQLTPIDSDERARSYRPIRPDGTPVDWETLDAEVVRVAGAAGAVQPQPQGFRADLWQRISRHFTLNRISSIAEIESIDGVCIRTQTWQWGWGTADREAPTQQHRADILARWAVYQELKPLYDIVDGAQGEMAMPRDVIRAWWDRAPPTDCGNDHCPWSLHRESTGLVAQGPYRIHAGNARGAALSNTLRNFAAVLDAVAEARVRARQSPANPDAVLTVTSERRVNVEPRRFADVRPDRHGWRWWRVITAELSYIQNQRFETINNEWRWLTQAGDPAPNLLGRLGTWDGISFTQRTVIPTDEQGNPVSWESIGQTVARVTVQPDTRWEVAGQLAQTQHAVDQPVLAQYIQRDGVAQSNSFSFQAEGRRARTENAVLDTPLPRFTADELDDVDHSRTTKLDQATLRRGKLPTVEQIAKYREIRAKRTGGTVADALKESRIDCEVAQYVLERWAGGLGDGEVLICITNVHCSLNSLEVRWGKMVDVLPTTLIVALLEKQKVTTLDTTEPPDTAAQQARQQAEERRQRLAQVQAQIAAERATTQPQQEPTSEPSRFDLIEPDPQADPTASIRAWEARQAAVKAQPRPSPCSTAAVPETRPHVAPAIDVVDAEADGLSVVDLVLTLTSRAMNRAC